MILISKFFKFPIFLLEIQGIFGKKWVPGVAPGTRFQFLMKINKFIALLNVIATSILSEFFFFGDVLMIRL